MKKSLILLIFLLVLINPVLSQSTDQAIDANASLQDLKKSVSKADDFLEKQREIPENIQFLAKIIFGVKDQINISLLIVLIAIWIGFLILIKFTLDLMPIIKTKSLGSWILAIAITTIIAISGAIKSIAIFWFNIGNFFKFLEEWSVGLLIFSITSIIIVIFITSAILKTIKEYIELKESSEEGLKAGIGLRILKALSKWGKD